MISIARIWGTSLGLQHPGLYPTKVEWKEQADIVQQAIRRLKREGLEADGRVVGSRHPSKVIAREAQMRGSRAIVIGRRPVSPILALLLQDEVRWLVWRAQVPVVAVPLPPRPG